MKFFKIFFFVFTILVSAFISGCNGGNDDITGSAGLIEALRKAGAAVEDNGNLGESVMSVPGKIIKVNNEDVQVYEYSDEEAVEQELSRISKDGSTIGNTMVSWIATPHFYRGKSIIVIYVGNNKAITGYLKEVLGNQFAGR